MIHLSVVIIAKDEEKNLPRCLNSVRWADEIIVVDSGSTDRTKEIAQKAGAKIYDITWAGFGQAKGFGVSQAGGEWILSLDADEEITPELADEIKTAVSGQSVYHGYFIRRQTNFLGKWINHCGWFPDRVLRLFRRARGRFDEALVHERVILDGPAGHLKGLLLHYSYPSLELYLRKSNRYTTMGAEEALRQGKRAGWYDILIRPPVAFFKHYISRQGFRDGWEGFVISSLSAMAVLTKYAKLRHLQKHPVNERRGEL